MPAEAGIQGQPTRRWSKRPLDPRLRGGDVMEPYAQMPDLPGARMPLGSSALLSFLFTILFTGP
jgi:hypothetical protein